ncbi:MAG: CPXCG motif-containing cysteine-rich protein [Actinomycetota bacterium]|nr:CPXCG motif-containing cysteine-rich protein [Actinomycetota bacterium]
MESTVACPYCGEVVTMGLDPGGGAVQEYIEDCPVCCQPWRVTLVYRDDGVADVTLAALDG